MLCVGLSDRRARGSAGQDQRRADRPTGPEPPAGGLRGAQSAAQLSSGSALQPGFFVRRAVLKRWKYLGFVLGSTSGKIKPRRLQGHVPAGRASHTAALTVPGDRGAPSQPLGLRREAAGRAVT